jgi:lipoprotein-releasing system permease protein
MSAVETSANGELNGRASPFGVFERSVAGRYLLAKRAHGGVAMISIISFVGIMLAVAVLIIVMSVMNGFRHDLLAKLLGAQGHIFVSTSALGQEDVEALAARLAAAPGVVRAAPVIAGQAGVMTESAFSGVQINGLAKNDLETLEIVQDGIILGGMEAFGEGERGGDSILIGSQLASRLGIALGDPVKLISPSTASTVMGPSFRQKTYYVDGIFSVGMSLIDDLYVYLPIEQARVFLGYESTHYADFVEVSIEDPDEVGRARTRLRELVGDVGRIRDWRDQYASYVSALNVERNVMRLILGLLILIAALNIISGLVMLAKNKSGGIAILRTMGATRGAIMRVFFMVGATIGILGTIGGIVLGTVFCLNIGVIQTGVEAIFGPVFPDDIYFLSQIPARIEWREVALIAVWGFAMSCVATLPPAWNAARLDPVEALRYG